MIRKEMAGGLLLTLSLALLAWGAEGQGNGRDKVSSHVPRMNSSLGAI